MTPNHRRSRISPLVLPLCLALLGLGSAALDSGCAGQDDKNPVASDDSGTNGGDDSGDSGADSNPCSVDTGVSATIDSPVLNATFLVGDEVALSASAHWAVNAAEWTVDGAIVADTISATWTATLGSHTVGVTLDTTCGTESAQVDIDVVASPVTVFGSELGLADVDAKGLSAGWGGSLWAATTAGLLHLDAEADAVRIYTALDGLYKDEPYAVLAHSDGTLWVGDVGDVDRQGSHFTVEDDGSLTLIEAIDFTESSEIQYVLRLREQPFGVGAGDVWMGTNEGLCLWDQDLGVFSEHAHPTHPHSLSYGVAFTPDASIWNGDQYQLSRWEYSNDGNLSPSSMDDGGDLAEYWVPWPVDVEEQIGITDLDADEWTVWIASSLYGVARVDVGTEVSTSTTTLLGDPFPATAQAIRADGEGHVWIGTGSGLYIWDTASETMTDASSWLPDPNVQQLTVDTATTPPTVWAATPAGFVRFVGVP